MQDFLRSSMTAIRVRLNILDRGKCFDFLRDRLDFRAGTGGCFRSEAPLLDSFRNDFLLSVNMEDQFLRRSDCRSRPELQIVIAKSPDCTDRHTMHHVEVLEFG